MWLIGENNSYLTKYKSISQEILQVKGHVDQGQSKAYPIGRWAHFNVKLHFFHPTLH